MEVRKMNKMSKGKKNWQGVIWRAWRHTPDREFADQLFEMVANEPVDWRGTVILMLVGAFYGAAVSLLVGLFAANWGTKNVKDWVVDLSRLTPFPALGAVIGALVVGLIRGVAGRRLTWRAFLKWLVPLDPPEGLVITIPFFSCGAAYGTAWAASSASPPASRATKPKIP
ncbi:MAG: hypothetical protein RMK18_11685 [Armatimonadota bacterium]|nr:hypothetical protein [Armatimonadota bacterium]MDW8026507.1 hypothetical protein [Armatimonadota bacterium]